jgi:dephospho-CoA kinase
MKEPARGQLPFVGLTGGIAAGKSEALAALERLGAATLSADAVVHELLGSDELRALLVERFGDEVAPGGGAVDRDALGALVFERPAEREWLEQQLWPRVGARIAEWRAAAEGATPRPRAAVVEVPLLFESGMEGAFDQTIAVVAREETCRDRAAARGHAGQDARSERQLSQAEKAQRADFVAENDGSLEDLERTMTQLLATMGP